MMNECESTNPSGQKLRSLGARKILVPGVGPLGCIPSQLARNLQTKGVCVARVNQLVVSFNAAVKEMMQQLNAQYNDTVFVLSDSYNTVYKLVNDAAYGSAKGTKHFWSCSTTCL